MAQVRKFKDLGELHALLLKACPPNDKGLVSIPILANKLGVSHQTVYDRWLKSNWLPADRVADILEIGEGRVTQEQLLPFVLRARV